jgi:hypothetical protein
LVVQKLQTFWIRAAVFIGGGVGGPSSDQQVPSAELSY